MAQPSELRIRPRSEWGSDLPPTGELREERPGDVRFLLVHHTASANGYSPASVPDQIRGFYRFHTADRGWPDVAYNFFIDAFGEVWEGRQGSLEGPVMGDATGGSQGFAILCCFIGDHRTTAPTQAAQASMVSLLAHQARSYGIDPSPGATTEFLSRGSNRWPEGTRVVTSTIAGHRDMSQTTCPGDAAYRLVTDEFPARVTEILGAAAAATPDPEITSGPQSTPYASVAPTPAASGGAPSRLRLW